MNTISIILIDDEPDACTNLENILSEYIDKDIRVAGMAHNTRDAEQKIRELEPDAIFLDIEMPNENAFQFLERIYPFSFEIIFVTAYDEYAIRAFKLNAVDYILKPINIGELAGAVKKLRERLTYKKLLNKTDNNYNELARQINQKKKQHQIVLRDKNDLDVVAFRDIIAVKAMGSYSRITFVKDGVEKSLIMSRSIADYEELFPADLFYRIHKSYLVNCFFIKRIHKDMLSIQLKNEELLPVSRRRFADLVVFLKNNNVDE